MFDSWAATLKPTSASWRARLGAISGNMYGNDEVLFNVGTEFLRACSVPLMVFRGDDDYHPSSASELIRDLCSSVVYVENWKSGSDMEKFVCLIFPIERSLMGETGELFVSKSNLPIGMATTPHTISAYKQCSDKFFVLVFWRLYWSPFPAGFGGAMGALSLPLMLALPPSLALSVLLPVFTVRFLCWLEILPLAPFGELLLP